MEMESSPSKKKRRSAAKSSSSLTGSKDQDRRIKKNKQAAVAAQAAAAAAQAAQAGGGSDDGQVRGVKRKIGCVEAVVQFGRKKNLDQHYTLGAQLGHGKFGSVHICYNKSTGEMLACKSLEKNTGEEGTAHREVEIMQHLSGHQGIVTLKEVFEDSEKFYLVMELCSGGRLLDLVGQEGGRVGERKAAEIVRELMEIVKYCHEMGVVHRDIKPENILLTDAGKLKLADFGLATRVADGQKLTGFVGSPGYVAPEVLSGTYSEKADIWSAGVLLHVLLLGFLPFPGGSKEEIFEAVKTRQLDFGSDSWQGVAELARDLVKRMVCRDVDDRLTAADVLGHPWILSNTDSNPKPKSETSNPNQTASSNSDSDLVDALAYAISRIEISEPKRTRVCGPVKAPTRLEIKTNLCTAF
ncbi:hypothetical protein LUZ60_007846 [Juncus effusus]|nr:hypothetical protein LUZ60_007846 [Juncus effusus]